MKRRKWVTVVYKSGAKVHVKVKDMTYTRNGRGEQEVTWDGLKPGVLKFGIDDVAAIWIGKL